MFRNSNYNTLCLNVNLFFVFLFGSSRKRRDVDGICLNQRNEKFLKSFIDCGFYWSSSFVCVRNVKQCNVI